MTVSNFRQAITGLITVLEANIEGLHGYDHPVDNVNEFPAAIVLPENLDPEIAFAGNTFDVNVRVVFLVASGDTASGFGLIYDHIDPTTEGNKSLIAAIRSDPTLDGKVDDSGVTLIENIGRRELWGGNYFGFDALINIVKTVP